MSSASIRNAVQKASAYLAEHPAEARYRDSHARARLGSDLTVDVDGPGGEQLRSDMPRGIGGTSASPSPGWYLRAAAAACVASLIGIRAAVLGIELGRVEVVVDSESDDRGILGPDVGVDAGALSMKVAVSIQAEPADQAALKALVAWAVVHCPVTDSIGRSVPIEVVIG